MIVGYKMVTFKKRTDFPDTDATDTEELAERTFQEEHRDSGKDDGNNVRDEESTAAVFVAEIGETPNVAESDGVTDGREDEFYFRCPFPALRKVFSVALLDDHIGG